MSCKQLKQRSKSETTNNKLTIISVRTSTDLSLSLTSSRFYGAFSSRKHYKIAIFWLALECFFDIVVDYKIACTLVLGYLRKRKNVNLRPVV